eukprot:7918531-Pyramimonas_sp.AAC.1
MLRAREKAGAPAGCRQQVQEEVGGGPETDRGGRGSSGGDIKGAPGGRGCEGHGGRAGALLAGL